MLVIVVAIITPASLQSPYWSLSPSTCRRMVVVGQWPQGFRASRWEGLRHRLLDDLWGGWNIQGGSVWVKCSGNRTDGEAPMGSQNGLEYSNEPSRETRQQFITEPQLCVTSWKHRRMEGTWMTASVSPSWSAPSKKTDFYCLMTGVDIDGRGAALLGRGGSLLVLALSTVDGSYPWTNQTIPPAS